MIERLRRAVFAAPPPRRQDPTSGGMPFEDLYPARPTLQRPRTYAPVRVIAASTQSVILAPANAARRGCTIANASTATLYVTYGSLSSSSSFTIKLGPGATHILEEPGIYQGDLAGVWDGVNGSAEVTEIT